MFEKEAKERAKDYTDNEKRQVAYECGFLDGVDFGYNKALEEATHNYNAIIADYDKVYNDNLDYSYHIEGQLTKAKELLKKVLDLKKVVTKAEEYLLLEEAEQFLSDVEK